MNDNDLWQNIDAIRRKLGVTDNSYKQWLRRGLPWCKIVQINIYTRANGIEIPIEQLRALNQTPTVGAVE